MSESCAFCLQDIADGAEFCPGGACRASWSLLFADPVDVVPDDADVYDDECDTLPLSY